MIWTIDGNDYMKAEARKLADSIEEVIKRQLNQTVSIEFKDAPVWVSREITVPRNQDITVTTFHSPGFPKPENVIIANIGFLGVRQGKEPEAEQSSVVVHEIEPAVENDDWF